MTDTMENFLADLRFILSTRGALRHQPLVRSHFWRRLEELRGRAAFR
jgi:hypothetical protein